MSDPLGRRAPHHLYCIAVLCTNLQSGLVLPFVVVIGVLVVVLVQEILCRVCLFISVAQESVFSLFVAGQDPSNLVADSKSERWTLAVAYVWGFEGRF